MKSWIALAGAAAFCTGQAFALPLYQTSFESAEGFSTGTFPASDPKWTVETPPVNISNAAAAADGNQYVELGAGAVLDFSLTAQESSDAGEVVWVEGYFRGEGSDVTLDQAVYPVVDASAIVHFSQANGIEVLDGTTGNAVQTGVSLGDGSQWFKITIALDFGSKTWEIWVNDAQPGISFPLGFRDTNLTELRGFKNLAQSGADFDGFRVVPQLLGDANGDGKIDAADIVRLLEFITNPPTDDPILFGNADVSGPGGDRDGSITNADTTALWASLIDAGEL